MAVIDNVVIRNFSIGALPAITASLCRSPDANLATGESLDADSHDVGRHSGQLSLARKRHGVTNDVVGTASTVLISSPRRAITR